MNATKHRLMVEISSGVAFLHAHGVVHRDLKPENIMISNDRDNTPHAKVADFGLAKVIASCQNQEQMMEYYMTSMCGTNMFMAPEVYAGHYTEKADVFSFGVLLLEIISGRKKYYSVSQDMEFLIEVVGHMWTSSLK